MARIKRFLKAIEVPGYDTTIAQKLNEDIRPLPPSRRTYGPWQFITLWVVTGQYTLSSLHTC